MRPRTGLLSRAPWPLSTESLALLAATCSTASLSTTLFTTFFRRIPFYYAGEATEAIKPVIGDLYHRDERSFMGQLWTNFTKCKYVVADESAPGALKWAQ